VGTGACAGPAGLVPAVFAFDLVAFGLLVLANFPLREHEIEVVCDTMHVNAAVKYLF